MKDPHDVLGVKPGAGVNEIREAYRRVVQIYHPDRFGTAPQHVREEAQRRMASANEAYRLLLKWAASRGAGNGGHSSPPPPASSPPASSPLPPPPTSHLSIDSPLVASSAVCLLAGLVSLIVSVFQEGLGLLYASIGLTLGAAVLLVFAVIAKRW